jgi:hypothetical protein
MHMTSTHVSRVRIIPERGPGAVIRRCVNAVEMDMRLKDRGLKVKLLSQFWEIESP